MIINFADKATKELYLTGKSRYYPQVIIKAALRKLDYLNAAKDVNDLRIPSGNRFKQLKSRYANMYSIRINKQYRVIFSFENSNAMNVEIIDYH